MPKKIFAVNISLPGEEDEHIDFKSDHSLLDADIIIFGLSIHTLFSTSRLYEGKPLLSTNDSFRFTGYLHHWRSELELALSIGKTVFVFLGRIETFYTERSTPSTSKIEVTNYSMLPISIGNISSRSGKEIRVARDLGPFANYWGIFSDYSRYEVCLEDNIGTTYFTTKTANKPVGVLVSSGTGNMVLLPKLVFDMDNLLDDDEENDELEWNEEGLRLGKQLINSLVEIDKALRDKTDVTQAPEWTESPIYKLENEIKIESSITEINLELDRLMAERSRLSLELSREIQIRGLLYEKGHALESAIMEALTLLRFKVEHYEDSESEFDVVIVGPEGRFIGEAEGKDSKPINIDKLSQLERELQEDFAREDISDYAKGILFGNAYRFTPLSERGSFFTEKCISGAKRSGIALVRTVDLFPVAKYLKAHPDDEYATACRKAIAETTGTIVSFPDVPINS